MEKGSWTHQVKQSKQNSTCSIVLCFQEVLYWRQTNQTQTKRSCQKIPPPNFDPPPHDAGLRAEVSDPRRGRHEDLSGEVARWVGGGLFFCSGNPTRTVNHFQIFSIYTIYFLLLVSPQKTKNIEMNLTDDKFFGGLPATAWPGRRSTRPKAMRFTTLNS